MLNTLYPPRALPPNSNAFTSQNTGQPTSPSPTLTLTPRVLEKQRDTLFQWIRQVELHGPRCLKPLMAPDPAHSHDENGWAAVHEGLDSYLKIALHAIEQVSDVTSLDDFNELGLRAWNKTDSGVSFSADATLGRPSTSGSAKSGGPQSAQSRRDNSCAASISQFRQWASETRHDTQLDTAEQDV